MSRTPLVLHIYILNPNAFTIPNPSKLEMLFVDTGTKLHIPDETKDKYTVVNPFDRFLDAVKSFSREMFISRFGDQRRRIKERVAVCANIYGNHEILPLKAQRRSAKRV